MVPGADRLAGLAVLTILYLGVCVTEVLVLLSFKESSSATAVTPSGAFADGIAVLVRATPASIWA